MFRLSVARAGRASTSLRSWLNGGQPRFKTSSSHDWIRQDLGNPVHRPASAVTEFTLASPDKLVPMFLRGAQAQGMFDEFLVDPQLQTKVGKRFRSHMKKIEFHVPSTLDELDEVLFPHFESFIEDRWSEVFAQCRAASESADLRQPHELWPLARAMNRKLILHVGPTNSGKTYNALKSLAESESGVYCGPLRLLAWEVSERLVAEGTPCDLLTGQERLLREGSAHVACTIEMLNFERPIKTAVVDEVQMIGDRDRGGMWTRALLGTPADEVHLCGSESFVDIALELADRCGDEVEVRRYKRLSPLFVAPKSLGNLRNVKSGDCVVAFSRKEIYKIKATIEKDTNHKCCVVYGSLPPETRKQQAELFNSRRDGYDVLVASDAIGMGLNLNIQRVVFNTLSKFDGEETRMLHPSEVLQIGGRAGRYGFDQPQGEVTCLSGKTGSLDFLRQAMASVLPQVSIAGLSPSFDQLESFAATSPTKELGRLLAAYYAICRTDSLFFMCNLDDMIQIAYAIERFDLSLTERFTFCTAPVKTDASFEMTALMRFANCLSQNEHVPSSICRNPSLTTNLQGTQRLKELEKLHHVLDLYVWMSFRFKDHFTELDKVKSMKGYTEDDIRMMLLNEGNELAKQDRGRGGRDRRRGPPRRSTSRFSDEAVDKDGGFHRERNGRGRGRGWQESGARRQSSERRAERSEKGQQSALWQSERGGSRERMSERFEKPKRRQANDRKQTSSERRQSSERRRRKDG